MDEIKTQRYIRKPLYVDAVRITSANFDAIAAWCQGEIQTEEIPGKGTSKKFIRVRVQNPKNPRQTRAYVGDWLLYTETGYKVYTVKAFHAAFDKVEPEPPIEEDPLLTERVSETETVVNQGEEREIEVAPGLPKYPEPQFEEATPEGIADAILQNKQAREGLGLASTERQLAAETERVVTVGAIKQLHEEGKLIPDIAETLGVPESQVRDALTPVPVDPEPSKIDPSAAEGKQVLSVADQKTMTAEEVRELVQSGDVVLAQDIAHP